MEAMENTLVVGAILWLVQTILDNLSISGKLDEWIRQVGLAEDMEKLRTEIERVETVVAALKGRANGNKPLARSLASLRELMYDADDTVDELDYFRLQQQVEGGATACANNEPEGAGLDGAEQVDESRDNPDKTGSSSKKRKNESNYWPYFEKIRDDKGNICGGKCKSCQRFIKAGGIAGTNGLKKHIESGKCLANRPTRDQTQVPTSASDGTLVITKRMRTDEASTLNITASAPRWNKSHFSEKIHQITSELQHLRGTVIEFLKDSVATADQYWSITLDTRLEKTSLAPSKVYGRDEDKEYIIRVITAAESDVVAVLPIVGIAGVGKTVLAQLVYNDQKVESQFERIWVCVNYNFDEVTLTRGILDFFQEGNEGPPKMQHKHQGTSGLCRLQEILTSQMQRRTKKFLLVLDDVWDSLDDDRWKRLLLPLQSGRAKGNVILVTTKDLSVAQRIGTEEPIKLDVLGKNDFWLLYKSFAFGDNCGDFPSLNTIGKQIAGKLKGNPLAAETAGKILREHLNLEHWSRILKNENWKSLQLNGGIMSALKLSYDRLPYHLKQCFLYCSIFPNNYQFLANDLIHMWISLGFVRCTSLCKKLDEIGQECLTNLVNLGFLKKTRYQFQKVKRTYYAICGIMHDFGRLVSRTEYATTDSLEFNKLLPTIRHLSVVAHSACLSDQHGNKVCNEKFEANLQSIFKQAGKLRTLILLGDETFFFRYFQDMLHTAQNLRVLQICAKNYEFCSLQGTLVSPVHLRHLKLESCKISNDFHQTLSTWYHLQVLHVDDSTTIPVIPMGMDSLVSLMHLVAPRNLYSESIGKVTSLQELNWANSDVTKLQYMSEIVQLGVYKLGNITAIDEAYGAILKDKANLEKLQLSWKDTLPQEEYDREEYECESEKEEYDIEEYAWESEEDECEREEASFPVVSDCNNISSSEDLAAYTSDVLEVLEPHPRLKHLQVSGYSGAEFPSWLGSSVSILQTLHLEDCGEWGELRFLGSLPFLTKLKLRNMQKVKDISIPSLEELILIKMPKLERCSCDSVRDLNSSLRVLKIVRCSKLKVFPLLGSCEIERKSWLFHLRELKIHYCSDLLVSCPLPPSSSICQLSIRNVSNLQEMNGSCNKELTLELIKPITNILAFHNMRVLSTLTIRCFYYPIFSSLEGFRHLMNLKCLEIISCRNLFSPDVSHEDISYEDMAPANINALPSLRKLKIKDCSAECLSVLLRNRQALEELALFNCDFDYPIFSSLEGFRQLINLKCLKIFRCRNLFSSDVWHEDTNYEDMAPENINALPSLRELRIQDCSSERLSVLLRNGQALEELTLSDYDFDYPIFSSLEGFRQLINLKCLEILRCRNLFSSDVWHEDTNYEDMAPENINALPSLRELRIQDCSAECLSVLLRNGQALEKLTLSCCDKITGLFIENEESELSNPMSAPAASSSGDAVIGSSRDGLVQIPKKLISSLKEMSLKFCYSLKCQRNKEVFSKFTSLRELSIVRCPVQISSCVHRDKNDEYANRRWLLPQSLVKLEVVACFESERTLRLCFPGHLSGLKRLKISNDPGLESLQLQDCTALEELSIRDSESLIALEGMPSLGGLRSLEAVRWPHLISCSEHLLSQGYDIGRRLEHFTTDKYSVLTPSFCGQLTSLKCLEFECVSDSEARRLTDEQERGLQRLTSLEELRFVCCPLEDLPVGLHNLPSLKRLYIECCRSLSRLPERVLPPSLEKLEIKFCWRLRDQCRMLATGKLLVEIDGEYVNL